MEGIEEMMAGWNQLETVCSFINCLYAARPTSHYDKIGCVVEIP